MRTSELNQLIESPERLDKAQINDLQELLSEYPYFTSAQLLLTKAFFESENLNFEKQLRLTAAYAGDRKKLHDLLYLGKKMGDEVSESTEVEKADLQSTEAKNEENTFDKNAGLGPRPSDLSTEQSEVDEQAKADQDFLDAQIMSAAIGNSVVDELETGEQSSDIQSTDSKRSEAFEEESISPDKVGTSDLRSSISEESEANFDEDQPHSFSDWLRHYSVHDQDDPSTFRQAQGGAGSGTKDEDDGQLIEKKSEGNQIIKSISDQAKQIQEKAEFYSASKMAKLSVTESDDLVTETLARVFEEQGKFEKAIKAYEKLRLKFPEKSVYFAGRIKAVKKKLKS